MKYLDSGARSEFRYFGERAECEITRINIQLVRLQAREKLILYDHTRIINKKGYHYY